MDSRKFKLIIIVSLIGSFPLTLLATSKVFATNPNFGNQSLSTDGLGFYNEDFTDQIYRSAATSAWGWGAGQLTSERNFSLVSQDFHATLAPCKGIDIQGRKAYIVTDHPTATNSLEILDITSPAFIISMSTRNSFQDMISIAIHGDYLYAGVNVTTQQINTYNATDPSGLGGAGVYMDNEYVDGAVTDIEPWGQLIYFTAYDSASDGSLRVIDASNPGSVQLITNAWFNKNAYGLDIAGQLAYVAASDDGFYVLNISDKYNAIQYDYLATPGFASDVVVDGRFAYLAAGEAGVHVIDVFDPTNIVLLGTYNTPGFARNLKKQGNTLYVADMDGGLVVLDVADPNNPSYATMMVFGGNNVWDVDTFGNYVFVATDAGVRSVLASSDGGGLMDFGANAYRSTFDGLQCWDVQVQGDIAYVAGGTDGFYTLNVRDPLNPILLDHYPLAGAELLNLDVEGQYAYCVDYDGVYIFDITDPNNIIFKALEGGSTLRDVDVEGELMYISFGAGTGGFGTVNNSDPNNPIFQSNIWFETNVTAIDVQGHHIYSVNNVGVGAAQGLHCHDLIPDVFNPDLLGSESRNAQFRDLFVDGDLAFCSDNNWLVVEDITNPTNPIFILDVDWGVDTNYVKSWGVCTFGTNIINAGADEGVHFLDGMDITPIFFTGTNYPNATAATKVTTHGDYTYVANQTSLIILRHFESPGDTYVAGNYIAESTAVDVVPELIHYATLNVNDYVPDGTAVDYYLSANGGADWELVTPGVQHDFINVGSDLQWRAEFIGPNDRSVHIFDLSIDYFYNLEPAIPLLNDPGNVSTSSSVLVGWTSSADDVGIDHYELQIDETNGFATPINTYNVSDTSRTVTGLTNGTYYFRVRAVDDYDLASGWSNVEDITVEITGLDLPWYVYVAVGGGLVLLILVIVIVVRVRKRKAVTTR